MRSRYPLAASAFFKGETPYLREWVEYHRIVGVEHFYMLNNDPDPAAMEVLKPYCDLGLMTVFHWPGGPAFVKQVDGYNYVCNYAQADWVAFLDLDEFLLPMEGDSIPRILADFQAYAGVSANWLVFGTSGHQGKQPLQIDAYRRCAPREYSENRQVKSIVRPTMVMWQKSCMHLPLARPPYQIAHEAGGPFLSGGLIDPVYRRLRVNHYMTRSEEDFAEKSKKWQSAEPLHQVTSGYFAANNRNEEVDELICRFVPAVREKLAHPPAK